MDGQVLKDNGLVDLDEKKTVVFLHGLLGNGKVRTFDHVRMCT